MSTKGCSHCHSLLQVCWCHLFCRWTDKLSGLLRTAKFYLQARLVRLDLGCVRLARDPSSSLIEPLAALTALTDLRMSVYSNGDATLTLQLSELSALSNLQVGQPPLMFRNSSPWKYMLCIRQSRCCSNAQQFQHGCCICIT